MTRTEWDALPVSAQNVTVHVDVMGLPFEWRESHEWGEREYNEYGPGSYVACGHCREVWFDDEPEPDALCDTPARLYTENWSSMREVVEKMHGAGFDLTMSVLSDGFVAEFRDYEEPTDQPIERGGRAAVDPRDGDLPLAVCIAALTALGHMEAS